MKDDKDSDLNQVLPAHRRDNAVKVSFNSNYTYRNTSQKNIRINFSIGSLIAQKLGWKDGDHIMIAKKNDRFVLKLKNPQTYQEAEYKTFKGYKFRKIKRSYSYFISMSYNFDDTPSGNKIRNVDYKIIEDKSSTEKYLVINMNK